MKHEIDTATAGDRDALEERQGRAVVASINVRHPEEESGHCLEALISLLHCDTGGSRTALDRTIVLGGMRVRVREERQDAPDSMVVPELDRERFGLAQP